LSSDRRIPFDGQAIGVIPARLASTRFPDKPLALIHNVPMVCWTLKRASQSQSLREVFVAAEDEAIVEEVQKRGGKARLVKGDFRSGSDRVARAVRGLDVPAVVNIQADEPLIEPAVIDQALALLESRLDFEVTTAVRPIKHLEEYLDPNCVKVVMDRQGRCLYFSRAPLPAQRHKSLHGELPQGTLFRKHIGLYCFRRIALQRFTDLPESRLESCESLEQLRILEFGGTIGAVETSEITPSIDSPQDLLALERHISEHNIG